VNEEGLTHWRLLQQKKKSPVVGISAQGNEASDYIKSEGQSNTERQSEKRLEMG
jgi:hypothetical protein